MDNVGRTGTTTEDSHVDSHPQISYDVPRGTAMLLSECSEVDCSNTIEPMYGDNEVQEFEKLSEDGERELKMKDGDVSGCHEVRYMKPVGDQDSSGQNAPSALEKSSNDAGSSSKSGKIDKDEKLKRSSRRKSKGNRKSKKKSKKFIQDDDNDNPNKEKTSIWVRTIVPNYLIVSVMLGF